MLRRAAAKSHGTPLLARNACISTSAHLVIKSRNGLSNTLRADRSRRCIGKPTIAHVAPLRLRGCVRWNSSSAKGSYHDASSTSQTVLSDVPTISPRSLVKYLDTYVVGQTKAKKVLAVGVWNHYLRVASNQRMKEEAERRLLEQHMAEEEQERWRSSPPAEENVQDHTRAWTEEDTQSREASSRSLRLGKYKQRPETSLEPDTPAEDVQDSWRSHAQIQEERRAERARDPYGEATRSLMFGRSEREWLVNAGGPTAIVEDNTLQGSSDLAPKFGDNLSNTASAPPARRVPAKTPAEEASSHLEQRSMTSPASTGEGTLAEAASRMHESVLADYTPSESASGKRSGNTTSRIGVFGADQPLYFSSNNVRAAQSENAEESKPVRLGKRAEEGEAEKKWESPQERAAYAADLMEERTKRALKLARERLSATSISNQSASTGEKDPVGPRPDASRPPRDPPPPTPFGPSTFLSTQPGTLPFFEKSNILLLGPSGSGKTLLLRTLAQALDVPFVHVDATPLTMAGYVGEDVESIIQRLLVEAGWDVNRAQRGIVCIDEIDKLRKTGGAGGAGGGAGGGGGKDVGGEGVQQALLRMLEGTTVQVADKSGAAAAAAAAAGGGAGKVAKAQQASMGIGTDAANGGGGLGPWYNHRRAPASVSGSTNTKSSSLFSASAHQSNQPASFNVDTSSILFVLSGAFVGIEEVIRRRLAASGAGAEAKAEHSTTGDGQPSQAELLAKLEPGDLEQYGLIPEFIGRVPVSVVLNPLTFDDLVRVMTEPKNSLVDQYTSLFQLNGIQLHISRGAIQEVVHKAMGTSSRTLGDHPSTVKDGKSNTGAGGGGARSLRRIMEEILLDAFYESYGSDSVKYILVDRDTVQHTAPVKLFSRGQRFEFYAQCAADDQSDSHHHQQKHKPDKSGAQRQQLDPARVRLARIKAKALLRSRLRRTNRLVDPVIYI